MFLSIILACYSESILDYSKIGKVDEARALYGSLKQLVETHKEEEPELVLRQAKGAVNLIYTFVRTNRPDEAQTVYEDLKKLAEGRPKDQKLRVWQANRAGCSLCLCYS